MKKYTESVSILLCECVISITGGMLGGVLHAQR